MSGSSASSHAGFSKLKFRYSTLELLNDILGCQIGWPGKEKKNIKNWKTRRKIIDLNILGKSFTTGSLFNSKVGGEGISLVLLQFSSAMPWRSGKQN